MTRWIDGRQVRTQPCDGIARHYRVSADGRYCGLICDDRNGWHTLPACRVGHVPPPQDHTATRDAALKSIVAEAFQ